MASTVAIRPEITKSQKRKLEEIKQRLSAFVEIPSGRIPVGDAVGVAIEIFHKLFVEKKETILPSKFQHLQKIAEIKAQIAKLKEKPLEDIPNQILIEYATKHYQESNKLKAVDLYHQSFVTNGLLEFPGKLKTPAVFL